MNRMAPIIEAILFRRGLEHKLDGYTLETSIEIADSLAEKTRLFGMNEVELANIEAERQDAALSVESGEGTPQLKDSVVCAARHSNTGANDPQECDWPFCGCDPHADKVIESLLECGWMSGQEASRLKIAYGKLFNENAAMTGLLEDSRNKLHSLYNEVHGADREC